MARPPAVSNPQQVRESAQGAVDRADRPVQATGFAPFSFFSFQYSYREISQVDGGTRVRARDTRFADGRLTTESFEGTTDAAAFPKLVADAQRQCLEQFGAMLEQFARFFPRR